uniref:Uncharacterized protein n=1 Tax=Vitrella brassicaformis TaxID=1169539 RepID=A0A7S1P7C0_9ALVE
MAVAAGSGILFIHPLTRCLCAYSFITSPSASLVCVVWCVVGLSVCLSVSYLSSSLPASLPPRRQAGRQAGRDVVYYGMLWYSTGALHTHTHTHRGPSHTWMDDASHTLK